MTTSGIFRMALTKTNLEVLLADGCFHSGSDLGRLLGISRGAVWKQIQALIDRGIPIDAVQGKGYRIVGGLDLLSLDSIRHAMSPAAKEAVPCIRVDAVVESTNSTAIELSRAGLGPPFACLAEQQSAGRGRRGRQWFSPFARNLYLTIAWSFEGGVSAVQGLSLVVGVAVCEALEGLGLRGTRLKWPNDILVDDKKLGGILIEVAGDVEGDCLVIIGVGINISMPGDCAQHIDQPWVDLRALGVRADRSRVAGEVLSATVRALNEFSRYGLEHFKPSWSRLDAMLGRDVSVQYANESIHGIARGIDDSGRLLVDASRGRMAIAAGEVSVRSLPRDTAP